MSIKVTFAISICIWGFVFFSLHFAFVLFSLHLYYSACTVLMAIKISKRNTLAAIELMIQPCLPLIHASSSAANALASTTKLMLSQTAVTAPYSWFTYALGCTNMFTMACHGKHVGLTECKIYWCQCWLPSHIILPWCWVMAYLIYPLPQVSNVWPSANNTDVSQVPQLTSGSSGNLTSGLWLPCHSTLPWCWVMANLWLPSYPLLPLHPS